MQTIDYDSIKRFWLDRSLKRPEAGLEAVVNFEEDDGRLLRKINLEKAAVMPAMELGSAHSVLDLGAGYGQWAMRFAPLASRITAVDYQPNLISLGRETAYSKGISNIDFVCAPAEEFLSPHAFDRFFLSGILHYLDDRRAALVARNLAGMACPDSLLILREPSSVLAERYVLDNVPSPSLGMRYSSLYRTPDEIVSLFEEQGFSIVRSARIFPPESGMDKYPETRLYLYQFRFGQPPKA